MPQTWKTARETLLTSFAGLLRGWRTEVKMDQPEFSITNNLYCPGIGKEIYVDFSSLRKQKLLSFI